jgi:hypothetical protein
MLRRSTWLLVFLVVLVAGVIIYLRQDEQATREEAKSFPTLPTRYLLDPAEGKPNRIRLESTSGGVVEVALNMQGQWEVVLPFGGLARQGDIGAMLTTLTSMRYIKEVEELTPSDLGLDPPAYVLTIYLKSGAQHILEIGDKTPSESGYYTRFDGKRLLIVELSSIEGLTLMADNPPYQVTPTPSPLPVTLTPEALTPYP